MDIRNSMDGLRSLLGVNPTSQSASQPKSSAATTGGAFDTDRATLSNAANEVSQAMSDEGMRPEKVAEIQSALAAGTYDVPVSAVASKLVDAMLSGA